MGFPFKAAIGNPLETAPVPVERPAGNVSEILSFFDKQLALGGSCILLPSVRGSIRSA